jgi:hypothetical protein
VKSRGSRSVLAEHSSTRSWPVEFQPEPRHHRLRPRQGLGRTSATEDDEVIGVRDDVCPERLPAPGQPPILQEPIHVDVGQQWAHDAALWRAAHVALA